MMDLLAEPWTIGLASWTLFTIISVVVQLFALIFGVQMFSAILSVNTGDRYAETRDHPAPVRPRRSLATPTTTLNTQERL
jgi:hypothetical protein